MCDHEKKICPRCKNGFECKVGNITQCQCYGINFATDQKAFIEGKYNDCLCRNCLLALKNEVEMFREKFLDKK